MAKIKCQICGNEYSTRGIHLHIWKKHTKEGKKQDPNIGYKKGTRIIWNKNKNLSKEYKEKISQSLKGRLGRKLSDQEKQHLSKIRIEQIKIGKVKRWNTISGNSYPEKYFEEVLKKERIKYEKQYHINSGKRNYFLDFFVENKIDLEIDGSQHQNKDRLISDEKRDKFVSSLGIKVFRIEWKNPNTQEGQSYLKQKIKELKSGL